MPKLNAILSDLPPSALRRMTSTGKTLAEELGMSIPRETVTTQTARATTSAKKMNGLEKQYSQHLDLLVRTGDIIWWKHHPLKLNLAGALTCWYEIDFMVLTKDLEVEFHETKGFMRDDANVKFKTASEQFPNFIFRLVKRQKGQWVIKTALSGRWVNT